MAAEDEQERDDKPGSAGRKSRARRQRPPVTIDLTAERVPDESASPSDEAPAEMGGPAQPEATPAAVPPPAPEESEPVHSQPRAEQRAEGEPPRATRPPGASVIGSDEGWPRTALAGVVGGLAALILLVVLQVIGLVPSPGRSTAMQASEVATAASNAAAALDRRVSAIEMITQNLPSTTTVAGLDGRVGQLQKEVGALATRGDLTVLENKLTALSNTVGALPPAATRDELAALAGRVGRLESGSTAAGSGGAAAGADQIAALSQRIDRIETDLRALGDRLAAFEGKPGGSPSEGAGAARAIAVVALKRAVDEGTPFTTDLDLAAALGLPADDVAALRLFAAKGVPAKATLAAEFPDVGDAIIRASQVKPNTDFLGRLMAGIGSLVTVRPVGPVEGHDPVAIVSRMRAAVDAGDLAAALAERDGLPESSKAVSADWAAAAQSRVTADTLVAKAAESIKPAAGNGPT